MPCAHLECEKIFAIARRDRGQVCEQVLWWQRQRNVIPAPVVTSPHVRRAFHSIAGRDIRPLVPVMYVRDVARGEGGEVAMQVRRELVISWLIAWIPRTQLT